MPDGCWNSVDTATGIGIRRQHPGMDISGFPPKLLSWPRT